MGAQWRAKGKEAAANAKLFTMVKCAKREYLNRCIVTG